MIPNLDCDFSCRFQVNGGTTTLAYYPPVYDKNGVNINPDGNITTSTTICLTCGRRWYATTQYNKTEYKEIK